MASENPDHHVILEVKRGASDEELQAAYRRLALRHHPDRNKGDEEAATARFQEVNRAFEALKNAEKSTTQYAWKPSTARQSNSGEEHHFAWFDSNWGPNFNRKWTEAREWGNGGRATDWSGERGRRPINMNMNMNFGFHTTAQHPGFGVFGRLFTHLPPLPPLEIRLERHRRNYNWRESQRSIPIGVFS
ncbi:DnaJ domain-containing protein [Nemania serpens]|nr:DnaJ domain-containing protein [Nemania serpens]